jgi:hypothetical protein
MALLVKAGGWDKQDQIMKILMLSPVPTHPPIADNRACILTLVDNLKAAGHMVHFAWAALESGDRIAMMKHFGEGFTELLYRGPKPSLLTRLQRRVQRQLGRASAFGLCIGCR